MDAGATNIRSNIGLQVLFWLAFLSAGLAYVLPIESTFGNVAIYWLSLISSLLIGLFLLTYVLSCGSPRYRTTSLDVAVTLYVAWIFISFSVNAVINILAGNGGYLVAQVQSFLVFLVLLLHYFLGRFALNFGLPFNKWISYVAVAYFVFCLFLLLYVFETEDLYLARRELGQRNALMIVFWAWFFGGIWLVTSRKKYFMIFLVGSIVGAISLTRAAYVQWGASAIAMMLAVGTRGMMRGAALGVLVVVAIALGAYTSSEISDTLTVVGERFGGFLFSAGLSETDPSASMRLQVWAGIIDHLISEPWALVIGYGQMGPSSLPIDYVGYFGERFRATSAHSQYLDTVVRAGIPGLMLELTISLIAICFPLFNKSTPVHIKIIAACLAGHLAYGVFHESIRWHVFSAVFWFFAGVIAQYLEDQKYQRVGRHQATLTYPGAG